MVRVNSSVKFSYEIAKGSVKQRDRAIKTMTDEIFNRSMSSAKEKYIYLKDYKKAIRETLPERKRLIITGIRGVYEGARNFLYDKNKNIIGQMLNIPKYSEIIRIEDVSTCMHEAVHFLDTLFNPKTTARANKMCKKNLFEDKGLKELVEQNLYHKEIFDTVEEKKEILQDRRKSVEKFLEGRPLEDKIDYIQDLRNDMLTEYKAYSNEKRIANKMYDFGYEIYPSDLKNKADLYMFKDKAEMLKQLGIEIIQKERHKNLG